MATISPTISVEEGLVPSGVSFPIESNTVLSAYDIFDEEQLPQLMHRHGMDVGFRTILRAMGFSLPTRRTTFEHWEKDWLLQNVTIGAWVSGTGAPGATGIISIDAGDMYVQAGIGNFSYPREGWVYELRNGKAVRIETKDTTTNPHRLTLKPVDASVSITAADFVAGQKMIPRHTQYAEGTGQPVGKTPRLLKYANNTVIIKEKFSVTGSGMTELTFEALELDGVRAFYVHGLEDTMKDFEYQADMALLKGDESDNITDTSLGYTATATSTQGLIPGIEQNGNLQSVVPGLYSIQDLDDAISVFNRERASKNYMVFKGFPASQEDTNLLVDFLKQTDVNFTKNGGQMSDELKVALGFDSFKKDGYTLNFKVLSCLDHPKGLGSDGFDYPNYRIFLPYGTTTAYTDEGGGGSYSQPKVGYRWKQLGDYSREFEVWNTGAAGGNNKPWQYTDELDIANWNLRGEIGFHGACFNQMLIQKP